MTTKRGEKRPEDSKEARDGAPARGASKRPSKARPVKRIKGSAVRGTTSKTAAEVRAELDGKPRPAPFRADDHRRPPPAPRPARPRPESGAERTDRRPSGRPPANRGPRPETGAERTDRPRPPANRGPRPGASAERTDRPRPPANRGPRPETGAERNDRKPAARPPANRGPRPEAAGERNDRPAAATGEVRKPRPQVRDLRAEKAGIVVTSGTGAPPVTAKTPKPAPKSKLAPQPRKPVEPVAPPPVRVRDENREPQPRRAGKIGILGRPNVGKSTLINALLGTRVAITSHHPQTTRDRIAGIVVRDDTQFVFLDTPGIHQARTKLGQRMNAFARDVGVEADVVLFVTDLAKDPTSELRSIDAELLSQLPTNKPVLLLINKIDKLERMDLLLPILEGHAKAFPWATIVPVSAYKKDGLDAILSAIENYLPQQDFLFPEDDISDKPIRFFVAEFVREAILRRTREEVPHGVAVTIDAFDEAPRVPRIDLTVHVDKDSHKPIILGARGTALQVIGTRARARVEELLGRQVHLQIHVRVTPGWYENEARLAEFGYTPTED